MFLQNMPNVNLTSLPDYLFSSLASTEKLAYGRLTVCVHHLVAGSQRVVGQQGSTLYRVRSVVDEDGPVLYL